MATRAYRAQRRSTRSDATRERIMSAVRELLAEGSFHESTVEEVAARAGVARATLYQHFGSRLGLVDAICELLGESDALRRLRTTVEVDDFLANSVGFWAAHEKLLSELYGVAAVDPAANALVERQRRDRQAEVRRLVRDLLDRGALGADIAERSAFAVLSLLTSFETYRELRRSVGLAQRDV